MLVYVYKLGHIVHFLFLGINIYTKETVAIKYSRFNFELDKDFPNEIKIHQKAMEAVKNTKCADSEFLKLKLI